MHNLHNLDDVVLMDMLAQHTERITHLFRNFRALETDWEYQESKSMIHNITSELERRRQIRTGNSTPGWQQGGPAPGDSQR